MKATARFITCQLFMAALAACGPNTNIPGTDGTTNVNNQPQTSSITSTGSTTGTTTGGIVPIGSTTTGNSNDGSGSYQTGTVSVTGSIDGNTFTAQDAVFAVGETADGLEVITVIIADQPNLCAFLNSGSGSANLVLVYVSSTNPNTYPTAGTYPVVNDSGNIPDSVSNDNAFSMVAFAGIGASAGTFGNAGQVIVETSAASTDDPESMQIQATDASSDSVSGTFTPAFCAAVDGSSSTTSDMAKLDRAASLSRLRLRLH